MAYREDITKEHLNAIGALLNKIASRQYSDIKPWLGFKYADDCLDLLNDVRGSLLERLPKLRHWKTWGPGYWHEVEGEEITYHALGFSFTPKWRATEPWFSGRFYFHAKGTVQWAAAWNDPRKKSGDYRESHHSIDFVSSPIKSSPGRTVKALDTERMAKTLEEAAGKWRII